MGRHDPRARRAGCDLKDGNACFMLGLLQQEGKGFPADAKKAAALFSQSCDLKDSGGCTNLGGTLMKSGDDAGAVKALERACELDSPNGCGMLGLCEPQGRGVAKDAVKAKVHLVKACQLGFQPACSVR